MPGDSKAVVRRLWEEVYNQRKIDVLATIASAKETQEVTRFYTLLTSAMPDLKVTIHQMLGEGDLVADVVTFHGTQTGPLNLPGMSTPPTGKVFDVRMVSVWQLKDGQIEMHWGQWDVLGFMRTLGVPLGGGPAGPPR